MKVNQFIILVAIFGLCFSTTQVAGNDTGLAQTPADSILVSNNVFTPNGDGGDGDNSFFEVKSKEENPVLLRVYNRFGTLVFGTEDKICRWDGRSSSGQKLENGVYLFRAEVLGMSSNIMKIGDVTLLDKRECSPKM